MISSVETFEYIPDQSSVAEDEPVPAPETETSSASITAARANRLAHRIASGILEANIHLVPSLVPVGFEAHREAIAASVKRLAETHHFKSV